MDKFTALSFKILMNYLKHMVERQNHLLKDPDVPEQVKADTRIRRNFLTTVIIPDMYDLRDTQIPEDLEDPLDESEVPY